MSLNMMNSDTNIRLGEVRFSYSNVFKPRTNPDGTQGKYSVCVIIPKSNTEAVDTFKKAFENAKAAGKTTKWGGKIPAKVQIPATRAGSPADAVALTAEDKAACRRLRISEEEFLKAKKERSL